MKFSRKLIKLALPGLLATAGLAFQTAGPAAANHGSGVMTGWEDPADDQPCGLPQSGFAYFGATFYLRDALGVPTVTVDIGPFRAAPQGAVSGGCGTGPLDPLTPIVPGAVTITGATVGGSACTLNPASGNVADEYTRVNSTVLITFNCNNETWTLAGNQNVCYAPDPFGVGYGSVTQPECLETVYPDPVTGGSSSHFILAYTHA